MGFETATQNTSSPCVGLNSDVPTPSGLYHVQTEDLGPQYRTIVTHVFQGGQVTATVRSPYPREAEVESDAVQLAELMRAQHRRAIYEVKDTSPASSEFPAELPPEPALSAAARDARTLPTATDDLPHPIVEAPALASQPELPSVRAVPTDRAAHLRILSGVDQGRLLDLDATPLRLGRGPHCALQLHEPTVAPQHCIFLLDDRGMWRVVCTASSSSLRVNGVLKASHGFDDRSADLEIGRVRLRYEPAPVEPARPLVESFAPMEPARPLVESFAPMEPARPLVESFAPMEPARPLVESFPSMQPARPPVESFVPAEPTRPLVESFPSMEPARPMVESFAPTEPARPMVESFAVAAPSPPLPTFGPVPTGARDLMLIEGGKVSLRGQRRAVAPFLLQRAPVTNQQFLQYLADSGTALPAHWLGARPSPRVADHPVVGVTLEEARGFAHWRGLRLPTAAEWAVAARGPEGRRFPWGETWDADRCASRESGATGTVSVARCPEGVSPDGCVHLVGNVWEWTDVDDLGLSDEPGRAWVFGGAYCTDCRQDPEVPCTAVQVAKAYDYLGFRCATDLEI